jgi:hypothetical protein
VVTASVIVAGCWTALHDGFGIGDLVALALWSLPLGVIIGAAWVVLRRAVRPETRALRVLVAATIGALLGVLWTLLMVRMMGPWFGTFSFPVLPILAASGALTLGAFASRAPVMHSRPPPYPA